MTLKQYFLSGVIFMAFMPAYAQVNEAQDILYVVQPGDNLITISEQRLDGPERWRDIAAAEHIDNPRRLQPGQVIHLPVDMLRFESKSLMVAFARGDSRVVQDGNSQPLSRGMKLSENQVIHTGDDGFVSLELEDGSRLYLSANSTLRINQFRYVPEAKRALVDFVLEQGHVETSVTPQSENSRFRVSTPLMVTGVRGTHFGVSYDESSQTHTNNVIEGVISLSLPGQDEIVSLQSAPIARDVLLSAGDSAVITAGMQAPEMSNLLPAPVISHWPEYIHDQFWLPTSVKGADDFVVRAYPKNNSDEILFESSGQLSPIGPFKSDGIYILEARALDQNNIAGFPAEHVVIVKTLPEPPLLNQPEHGAKLPSSAQNLVCANLPKIQRYFLQVALDNNFSKIVDEKISEGGCNFVLNLQNEGVYYWRVAALDETSVDVDKARGKFSEPSSFEVTSIPAAPKFSQNYDGDRVLLQWPEVKSSYGYLVEVSDTPNFATTIVAHETTQTEATIELASSCKGLYVRVQSVNEQGIQSSNSIPQMLQGTPSWCTGDGALLVDAQGDPVVIH